MDPRSALSLATDLLCLAAFFLPIVVGALVAYGLVQRRVRRMRQAAEKWVGLHRYYRATRLR